MLGERVTAAESPASATSAATSAVAARTCAAHYTRNFCRSETPRPAHTQVNGHLSGTGSKIAGQNRLAGFRVRVKVPVGRHINSRPGTACDGRPIVHNAVTIVI